MSRKQKSDKPSIYVHSFEAEIEKLIDRGSWEVVSFPICHRFGDRRFITYARPNPAVATFYLGGKKWRVKGVRRMKDYANELYDDNKGRLRHVEIDDSRYQDPAKMLI